MRGMRARFGLAPCGSAWCQMTRSPARPAIGFGPSAYKSCLRGSAPDGSCASQSPMRRWNPGTSVKALNFHGGSLELTLGAPDAASLAQLSQSLRENGWQADLGGGTNTADGYQGHLQVHANGT